MALIDPPATGWLDWLREHALTAAPAHTVILLDGAFLPGMRTRLEACASCVALFEHGTAATAEALDVSPLLIDFDPEHTALHTCLADTSGLPALSVLRSTVPATLLADSLAAWCLVDIDGTPFNFRFADTRRQPAILRTLDDAQRTHMLGPVTQWHCLGRDGHWHALPLGERKVSQPALRTALTTSQVAALLRDAEADEYLALLADTWPPGFRAARPSQRHRLVEEALRRADEAGIDSPAQRLNAVRAVIDGER